MRVVVFLVLFGMIAVAQADASPQSASMKDWTVRLFDDGSALAQTFNDSASALGVYCEAANNCQAYLVASTDCEAGSKYTVMLNSNSGAQSLGTTCAKISTPEGKARFALIFDEAVSVLDILLKDRVAGFSIPMADGTFKVTRFSLEGSNEALSALNQAIKKGTKPTGLEDEVL